MMNSERTVKIFGGIWMDHIIQETLSCQVSNDPEINRTVLCFIDVVSAQVLIRIDTDCELSRSV